MRLSKSNVHNLATLKSEWMMNLWRSEGHKKKGKDEIVGKDLYIFLKLCIKDSIITVSSSMIKSP